MSLLSKWLGRLTHAEAAVRAGFADAGIVGVGAENKALVKFISTEAGQQALRVCAQQFGKTLVVVPTPAEVMATTLPQLDSPAAPELKVGSIIEFEVDCDVHTPEFVAKLRGITGEYLGEKLTGRHWFKVRLDKAPERFTDEASVKWAKQNGGLGILPGQVAEAFRQKFTLVAKLGVVAFSGGFWRSGSGIYRHSVYLDWYDVESCLYGPWYRPTFQWVAGNVFPVVLEHKKL